ncbi:hypothetical protein [Novosphingobium sp. Gsoil 351]|uniref:hypothetical protein n=1 Tax=Novosphingobium sp. Gsoil 351 TaxID=2675225 RepID=UPI0012B4BED4|nr:hypothetical protein [Novosphingobium sp. Gsoil 351]QGN54227.1 hypothetical protein GKE62_06365 [Novosphingobium sp. Gsoil 351]
MTAAKPKPEKTDQGCLALVALVGVILLVVKCADSSQSTSASSFDTAPAATDAPTPTPTPVLAQSKSDLGIGAESFTKVAAVDDATSSMIFSKNCYAALEERFTWSKLDQCGAFDALAVHNVLEGLQTGSDAELTYLDGEAAAGRFFAAAKSHADDQSTMDERWSALDAYAAGVTKRAVARLAAKAAASEAESEAMEGDDTAYVDANGNVVTPATGDQVSDASEEE